MIHFSQQISVGDIFIAGGIIASVVWNYFSIHRRLDRLDDRQTTTETRIDDLRRGRGLILGEQSDWPDAVRRCFGFGANGSRAS